MTTRRVIGTETEYGISVPGQPSANHMVASSLVVNGYAGVRPGSPQAARQRRARWDFEEENPLRDARGFEVARDGEPVLDDDLGLANLILTNGARLYVDHAHPEFSTPECANPRDVVVYDKAGERIMHEAALQAAHPSNGAPGTVIQLYKNNTDNKGASYGAHENYLMARSTPFGDVVRHLTPFFVTRQVVCGAGRVGLGQDGRGVGFQISQRADFFEVEVGLETTLKRPIINTRDEPHADPEKYRRLHVIIGDANLSEVSTFLRVGTTSLVLSMIEEGFLSVDLAVEQPVASLRAVSHDPGLRYLLRLRDGRRMTGVQLQMEYLEQAKKYVEDRYGSDVDPVTADVLLRWESVLTRLEVDPMQCHRELDWVAKLELLEGYRVREGLDWNAHKLQLVDLQYSDIRPDRGLYNRLVARGRLERIVSDAEIERAMTEPPDDTRAYFRGRCLAKFPDEVAAASWDSVIFDVGRESLQRVPTMEPLRGTKAHVGALLDSCESALELVETLAGHR